MGEGLKDIVSGGVQGEGCQNDGILGWAGEGGTLCHGVAMKSH